MHHITAGEKSVLVGDEATELLLQYAALIARAGSGDDVRINAVSSDGDDVVVTFLLNSGTPLVAETAHSSLPEPENAAAIAYLKRRLAHYGDFQIDGETDDEARSRPEDAAR